MTSHPSSHRRRTGLAGLATAPLLLVGCGDDPEIVGGPSNPVVTVNEDVEVIGIQLAYPVDGQYEVGEDVPLYVALTNTGTEPVTLVDVTGPDFTDAVSSDGSADEGDALEIVVAQNDNTYIGAEGQPSITLVGLETELRSSQAIPVTFVFEDAGEVTAEAVVSAEDGDPTADFSFPDPDEDPTDDEGFSEPAEDPTE